jgi:hypothetical protein
MASSLAVEWAKDKIRVNCIVRRGELPSEADVRSVSWLHTDCVFAVHLGLSDASGQSLTRTILDANPVLRETWERLTPMVRRFRVSRKLFERT